MAKDVTGQGQSNIQQTFLRPWKKGSDDDSADAVGGVGGELLHTPKVAMTTPRKAGIENISNCRKKMKKILRN